MNTLKNALMALSLIAGAVSTHYAFAAESAVLPIRTQVHVAHVLSAVMDPRVMQDTVTGGAVTLDLGRQTLKVELEPSFTVELPLVGSYQDTCGATVYVARKDLRTTDGDLQQLELHDNMGSTCDNAAAQTEIVYTTSGHAIDTQSVIEADALMPRL